MKMFLVIIVSLVLLSITIFFILGWMSKSGGAIGLNNGVLSTCPNTPNCICSDHKIDSKHYIEPIFLKQKNTHGNISIIKEVIQQMGGEIIFESDIYIAATFTSVFFGFVDDLEIRMDPIKNVIHFRSASRVGYSDRGVNKKRISLLKKTFLQHVYKTP